MNLLSGKLSTTLLVIGLLAPLAIAAAQEKADRAALQRRVEQFSTPPAEFADRLGNYRSVLVAADGTAITTREQWQKRRAELKQFWHDMLGPWPALLDAPEVTVLEQEQHGDIQQQHIKLQIAPELYTEDAYLLVPPGEGPFPAVVVVYYDAKTGIGEGKPLRDFAKQLALRGFVTLSLGSAPETFYPNRAEAKIQPLSFHAYVAANCCRMLGNLPQVDADRIGIVGHSYGGKWAMFASCLYDGFACAAWSDPGIVFDEQRSNVNYWEPWYLGFDPNRPRPTRGLPTEQNPAFGPYKKLLETGHDLHELHVLMAPRPFLVSGGAEDPPERWIPLNQSVAVNRLLGYEHRVAMTNRKTHDPTEESNAQLYDFFDYWLKRQP